MRWRKWKINIPYLSWTTDVQAGRKIKRNQEIRKVNRI
jgi:hypothetical protein